MKKLSLRKKRTLCTVLCAALAMLTAAQSIAVPENIAYAVQTSGEEETNNVGGQVLDDVLDEIILYRWVKYNGNNYPKDKNWHPMLTLWGSGKTKVMNPSAPGDIYLQDSHEIIEGAKWFGRDGNGIYPLSNYNDTRVGPYSGTNLNVDPIGAAALRAHDTANYKEISNGVNKDVFYTTSSYNCTFARYAGIEEKTKCPYFTLTLSSGEKAQTNSVASMRSEFVINLPNGRELGGQKSGQLKITKGDSRAPGYEDIVFQPDGYGQYHIFDYNISNPNVYLVLQDNFFIGESKFDFGGGYLNDQYTSDADTCDIYFGETFRYSAVAEDTTVGSGQVLSIAANDYIDAKGNEQSQNGVMLPVGKTITIEKGGILSISGDFINNGTIINNGGTVLIQKGGNIFPFRTGSTPSKNGCGTIKCLGGDIIIKQGGALYAGLNDETGNLVPFYLDENSTLINQGLLVYGSMRLGESARVECYNGSKTFGSWFMGDMQETNLDCSKLTSSQLETVKKSFEERGFNYIYNEGTKIFTYLELKQNEQLDMLSKYNQNFLENKTDSLKGVLMPAGNASLMVGEGAYVPSNVSEAKLPHFLVGTTASVNDSHFDKKLKQETLTI